MNNVRNDDTKLELQELIATRRRFHGYPELGFREFVTTATICAELDRLGFRVFCGDDLYGPGARQAIRERIGASTLDTAWAEAKAQLPDDRWLPKLAGGLTGVIASLKCGRAGAKVGVRVDLDALPITESTEAVHLPAAGGYASRRTGCMHACGHDGHATIGLGLARRISKRRDELSEEVVLIFQPAEEIAMGAELVMSHESLTRLNHLVPVHLGLLDRRAVVLGVNFAGRRQFEVSFLGRNAHAGAAPQNGRNALQAACSAVLNLYGISRHSGGVSRIGIGEFRSPNAQNVVADAASFVLEVRGQSAEVLDYMTERAKAIVRGAGIMFEVETQMKPVEECPIASNSPETSALLRPACLSAGVPPAEIMDEFSVSGSEDATRLMNLVQDRGGHAAYMAFGSPIRGGHHNPKWDFDEDLLLRAVQVLWEFCRLAGRSI